MISKELMCTLLAFQSPLVGTFHSQLKNEKERETEGEQLKSQSLSDCK